MNIYKSNNTTIHKTQICIKTNKGDHRHQSAPQYPKFHLKVDHQQKHNLIFITKHNLTSTTKERKRKENKIKRKRKDNLISTNKQKEKERKEKGNRRVRTSIPGRILIVLKPCLSRMVLWRCEEHQLLLFTTHDWSRQLECRQRS